MWKSQVSIVGQLITYSLVKLNEITDLRSQVLSTRIIISLKTILKRFNLSISLPSLFVVLVFESILALIIILTRAVAGIPPDPIAKLKSI